MTDVDDWEAEFSTRLPLVYLFPVLAFVLGFDVYPVTI